MIVERHSSPLNTVIFEGNDFLSFVGTFESLSEAERIQQLTTLGGTSSGAIVAMLFALGYTSQQVLDKLKQLKFIQYKSEQKDLLAETVEEQMWDIEPIAGIVSALDVDPKDRMGKRFRVWLEHCIAERLQQKTATLADLAKKHTAKPHLFKNLILTAVEAQSGELHTFSADYDGNMPIAECVFAAVSFSGNFAHTPVPYDLKINNPVYKPTFSKTIYSNKADDSYFPIESEALVDYPVSSFDAPSTINTGILHVKSTWATNLLTLSWFNSSGKLEERVSHKDGNLYHPSAVMNQYAEKSADPSAQFPSLDQGFAFNVAKRAVTRWLHLFAKPKTTEKETGDVSWKKLIDSEKTTRLEKYPALLKQHTLYERNKKEYEAAKASNNFSGNLAILWTYDQQKSDHAEFNGLFKLFKDQHDDVIAEYETRKKQLAAIDAASKQILSESSEAKVVLTLANKEHEESERRKAANLIVEDQQNENAPAEEAVEVEPIPKKYQILDDLDERAINAFLSNLNEAMSSFDFRNNQPCARRNLKADLELMTNYFTVLQFLAAFVNHFPNKSSSNGQYSTGVLDHLCFLTERVEKTRMDYMNYMLTPEYQAREFLESLERLILNTDWDVSFQFFTKKAIRPDKQEKILPTGVLKQLAVAQDAINNGNYVKGQESVLELGQMAARKNNSFFTGRHQSTKDYYALFQKADVNTKAPIMDSATTRFPAPAA